MPFNVNDPTVDALLDQVMKKTGIKTKVGAIRTALQNEVARLSEQTPIRDKFAAIRAKKKASILGGPVAGIDHKAMMDRMWEDGQ